MRMTATWQRFSWPFSKKVTSSLFWVLVLFYLGFHAVSGERGVFALFSETRKLAALNEELTQVKQQREDLDRKVRGLSNHSLDLDLLDERARMVLGLADKNEVVYFLNDGETPE